MAGFLSDYLANALLNKLFRNDSFTFPSTLYCALFTVAPTASGGGTEVTGGSYARVSMTVNTTNFTSSTASLTRNAVAITFPAPTADWAPSATPVVGAAWFDASTSGNMIMYGPLATSRTILNGDPAPVILANGGSFTLA